jgi:hypothetical protein
MFPAGAQDAHNAFIARWAAHNGMNIAKEAPAVAVEHAPAILGDHAFAKLPLSQPNPLQGF